MLSKSFYSLDLLLPEPPKIAPLSFGRDVMDEGDFGQLLCTVLRGDPPFTFSWNLQGAKVSDEAGLSTTQLGQRASMLMIERVGHRHSGTYTCRVANSAGQVSAAAKLKVNGRLAVRKERRTVSQERSRITEFF